jgi:hypothetical protein
MSHKTKKFACFSSNFSPNKQALSHQRTRKTVHLVQIFATRSKFINNYKFMNVFLFLQIIIIIISAERDDDERRGKRTNKTISVLEIGQFLL